jgi:hypothetical protein
MNYEFLRIVAMEILNNLRHCLGEQVELFQQECLCRLSVLARVKVGKRRGKAEVMLQCLWQNSSAVWRTVYMA